MSATRPGSAWRRRKCDGCHRTIPKLWVHPERLARMVFGGIYCGACARDLRTADKEDA